MYPAEKWEHIQRLKEVDRKRGTEAVVETTQKKIKKRKAYIRDKDYTLEREIDEVQEELDAEKEKRTKRKHGIPAQAAQPSARETESEKKAELKELKV